METLADRGHLIVLNSPTCRFGCVVTGSWRLCHSPISAECARCSLDGIVSKRQDRSAGSVHQAWSWPLWPRLFQAGMRSGRKRQSSHRAGCITTHGGSTYRRKSKPLGLIVNLSAVPLHFAKGRLPQQHLRPLQAQWDCPSGECSIQEHSNGRNGFGRCQLLNSHQPRCNPSCAVGLSPSHSRPPPAIVGDRRGVARGAEPCPIVLR